MSVCPICGKQHLVNSQIKQRFNFNLGWCKLDISATVMENHLDFGSADEHSCSDSGWTIYFGSTTQNENENNSKDKYTRGEDDDESEDSMASDASSGPSHHDELPNGGSRSLDHIKHAKDTANSKLSSAKKPCKQFKKKDERRVKEQNRHSSYRAETAASQVSSGAKVRKTKMISKEE